MPASNARAAAGHERHLSLESHARVLPGSISGRASTMSGAPWPGAGGHHQPDGALLVRDAPLLEAPRQRRQVSRGGAASAVNAGFG